MKFRGKIILPAALFTSAVFFAEGVSGFTSAQLSLFYHFLTISASALIASLAMALASIPMFLGNATRKRQKRYK